MQRRETRPLVASVRDLRVHFNTKAGIVHAVDGVSFDIRDNETLGLVGETGCGKSVTARSFIRLIPTPPGICRGQIDFLSSEARRYNHDPIDLLTIPHEEMLSIRGDRIAMIFQDRARPQSRLSIRSQIAEVFYQHRSDDILEALGPDVPAIIRRAATQETSSFERFLMRIPPWRAKAAKLKQRVDELTIHALAETQIGESTEDHGELPHELSGG